MLNQWIYYDIFVVNVCFPVLTDILTYVSIEWILEIVFLKIIVARKWVIGRKIIIKEFHDSVFICELILYIIRKIIKEILCIRNV